MKAPRKTQRWLVKFMQFHNPPSPKTPWECLMPKSITNYEALGKTKEAFEEQAAVSAGERHGFWRVWMPEFPPQMVQKERVIGSFQEFADFYKVKVHSDGDQYHHMLLTKKQLDGFMIWFR